MTLDKSLQIRKKKGAAPAVVEKSKNIKKKKHAKKS